MNQGYQAHPPVNAIRRSAWADFLVVGGLLVVYELLRLHFLRTAGIRASGELDSRLRIMGENLIPGGEWFTTGFIIAALVCGSAHAEFYTGNDLLERMNGTDIQEKMQ